MGLPEPYGRSQGSQDCHRPLESMDRLTKWQKEEKCVQEHECASAGEASGV